MLSADAVLVLRCQEDDLDAFDEIVALYKDGIYNYICRMVSNRDDVEDLTQEVFLRAFSSIKKFRREANLRTWLYRIASNLCVDKYRRWGLEKQLMVPLHPVDREDEDSPLAIDMPDSTYDPQQVYERSELQQQVQRAICRLSDKLRAPILLYDIEGMSYEEISQTLSIPVGTVKSRIFKARIQLKEMLRPYVTAN